MAGSRANMTRKPSLADRLMRRYLVACLLACLPAISAWAQGENVVVTLLPSETQTTETQTTVPAFEKDKDLSVVAKGSAEFPTESKAWLYFDASALPDNADITDVRLQLVLKKGTERGMTITVAPVKGLSATAAYSAFDEAKKNKATKEYKLRSDLFRAERSDFVSLPLDGLFQPKGESPGRNRYVGLVLLPQPNAAARVYYGLNPDDINEHPDRMPRLIITYSRNSPKIFACSSEPSALAFIQSDGRAAVHSNCGFVTTPKNLVPEPGTPTNSNYFLSQVAAGTRTTTPVVYGEHLYVVRGKEKSETRLEELSSLGSVITSVPLNAVVREGSPLVVDRFGRLRIITNDEILTIDVSAGLKSSVPVDHKDFVFNQVPKIVVPGPDGTLYIVKQGKIEKGKYALGIFALNPEVGKLESGKIHPEKLWEVETADEESRITLSPDGRFLYALAHKIASKSRFIAINAQTGKWLPLDPGKVNLSGNEVTWVSGMKFDGKIVGQTILLGGKECTVKTKRSESLTCVQNMGTNSNVNGIDFPDNLNTFRNPVVTRGLNGEDFVYIAGNSRSEATLWAMTNKPVTQRNGDVLAQLTPVWEYPMEEKAAIGQPILGPTTLQGMKLYFLQNGGGAEPKLVAVKSLDGNKVSEATTSAKMVESTDGVPVVDSAGDVILWASNTLYGFTADTNPLFTAKPDISFVPQLLFGPGGTLYARSETSVSALVPSFQQSDTGPTTIYSPTHLYVTGSAARQGVKAWTLGARGSVILGENFSVNGGETVNSGETLSVCVNADRPSVNACK